MSAVFMFDLDLWSTKRHTYWPTLFKLISELLPRVKFAQVIGSVQREVNGLGGMMALLLYPRQASLFWTGAPESTDKQINVKIDLKNF